MDSERGGRTGWECGKHCKKKPKNRVIQRWPHSLTVCGKIYPPPSEVNHGFLLYTLEGIQFLGNKTIFESTPWSSSLAMLWKNVETHWKCTTGTTSEARNLPISSCKLLGRPTGCIAFDTWQPTWHGIFPRERAIRAEFSPQGDQGKNWPRHENS